MNRAQLIEKVRAEAGLSRSQAESAVESMLTSVAAAVTSGERVSLFGFGAFIPSDRAARLGRNPRTGEAVKIAPSRAVRFIPSVALKAAMNQRPSGKKTSASRQSDTAATARQAPAKKGPTGKKAPGKKASAKKAPGKKAPAKKADKATTSTTKR